MSKFKPFQRVISSCCLHSICKETSHQRATNFQCNFDLQFLQLSLLPLSLSPALSLALALVSELDSLLCVHHSARRLYLLKTLCACECCRVAWLKVFFLCCCKKVASDCCCLLLLIAVASCRLQVASCQLHHVAQKLLQCWSLEGAAGVCHPRDAAATSHLTLWWTVSTTATNEAGRKNWAAAGVAEAAHSRCNRKICY